MRVRCNDQLNRRVEFLDDVPTAAFEIDTLIDGTGLFAAFMHEHDNRLNAFSLQHGHEGIDGLGLFLEYEARRTTRTNNRGCGLRRDANEGNFYAIKFFHRIRRKQRLTGCVFNDVRCEKLEFRTDVRRAVVTVRLFGFFIDFAAAIAQTLQVRGAVVEFMVSDGMKINANEIHRFDRWLVPKKRR